MVIFIYYFNYLSNSYKYKNNTYIPISYNIIVISYTLVWLVDSISAIIYTIHFFFLSFTLFLYTIKIIIRFYIGIRCKKSKFLLLYYRSKEIIKKINIKGSIYINIYLEVYI